MIYFGHRVVNGYRSHTPKGYYHPTRGHTGIDVLTPEGTELLLPVATKVMMVNKQNQMGLTLYLKDPKGNILVFAHLSQVKVKHEEDIPAGKVFALTGNTGSVSTGPHLHFEVIDEKAEDKTMVRNLSGIKGFNVDPIKYLDSIFKFHWSDEAMEWMEKHEIISKSRHHDDPVKWGELAVVLHRLAKKIIEWTSDPKSDD